MSEKRILTDDSHIAVSYLRQLYRLSKGFHTNTKAYCSYEAAHLEAYDCIWQERLLSVDGLGLIDSLHIGWLNALCTASSRDTTRLNLMDDIIAAYSLAETLNRYAAEFYSHSVQLGRRARVLALPSASIRLVTQANHYDTLEEHSKKFRDEAKALLKKILLTVYGQSDRVPNEMMDFCLGFRSQVDTLAYPAHLRRQLPILRNAAYPAFSAEIEEIRRKMACGDAGQG